MAKYKYKARDTEGLPISGELDVSNEDVLSAKLEEMGYTLIEALVFEEAPASTDVFEKFRKINLKQMVEFSVQLSTLINAGIPLLSGLEVMEDQAEDPLFKKIITKVRKDVSGGITFSDALAEHKQAFNQLYVSMIRAGEATGELDKILSSLALFLEKENENKNKIKAAMMYPLAMACISLGVVIFLVTSVLPNFVEIFKSSGVKLPLPTQIVMGVSNFVIKDWYFLIAGVFLLIFSYRVYSKTEKGHFYIDRFKFQVPIFGPLAKKSSIARFSRTLGTLIQSSVPILQSLEIVKDTVGNMTIAVVIDNIRHHVRQGGIISEQLNLSGIFPKMVTKMVAVGENTGSIDKMLMKIADFYDSEVESEIKGLSSILEPVMIVGMGLIIGVIVLSVMLPMFDMMQVAKK